MSLYLEHFGLLKPPFRISPHTDFFFTGANRGPTLEALIYAITQDEGIIKVTGEVGSGKTMLCRMLLECLPRQVESLYLANPSLSRSEILGAIADELGVPFAGKTTHSMIRTLQDALVQRYADGKRVVILIDEAHAMPAESLEEIRLLSNLESNDTKLLQIVLFAQPELEERLASNDMRQLRERITQHFNLSPLTAGEVGSYLEFRLRAAGYRGPSPFTERAIALIAKISEGLSRRINILADKSLLVAYSAAAYKVDIPEIQAANQDARFSPLQQKPAFNPRYLLWGIGGSVVATLAAAIFTLWLPRQNIPIMPTAASTPAMAPALFSQATAAAQITPQQPSTRLAENHFGPLTQEHFARFAAWQADAAPTNYFIQLLATDAASTVQIENFLARATKFFNPDELRAYRSSLSGRDRVGVIYGDFPTRQAASVAVRNLPEAIRLAQPYPRQVAKLQQ